MNGTRKPEQISRPPARLERKGIEVLRGEVERIAPAEKQAVVSGLCGGRRDPHSARHGEAAAAGGGVRHAQAAVVARNVAAAIAGKDPPARFDGRGACFVETCGGKA